MTAKILVLDIETSPNLAYVWGLFKQTVALNQIASVGQVISFAYRWHGEKKVGFHSDHHDGHGVMLDRAHELISEADIVVHWNGNSFDMTHLQREFLLGGYLPPAPHKNLDLYLASKSKFRFTSHKLDHVAQQLGVGAKLQHAGFSLWRGCMDGDEKSWSIMRRYNMQDVVVTDRVYDRLKPWISHPHVGLFSTDASVDVCGRCGSKKLQSRGTATTSVGLFQRFQCQGCGGWSRAGKRLNGVDVRPA